MLRLCRERVDRKARVVAHPSRSPAHCATALTLIAALLVTSIIGCAGEPVAKADPSTGALSISNDSAIETARRSASVAVVLFQTPTDCLTCSADLYRWIELARESHGAFLIALSEEPTPEETAAIKRLRLKFTVLREPQSRVPVVVPPAIAIFRGPDTLIFEDRVTAHRRSKLLDSARLALQRM